MNMLPSLSTLRDEKHQELQTRCSLKVSIPKISSRDFLILCSHPLDAELLVASEDS